MNNDIIICKLEKKDISIITELISNIKIENGKIIKDKEKIIIKEQLEALLLQETSIKLVAKKDDIILGYISGHMINFPLIIGKECYISELLVRKDSRGLGIGNLLLKNMEIKARESGCTRLMLDNPKFYESYKRKFYEKKGFEERDNFANFVKPILRNN